MLFLSFVAVNRTPFLHTIYENEYEYERSKVYAAVCVRMK